MDDPRAFSDKMDAIYNEAAQRIGSDIVEQAMRGDRDAFGLLVVHTSDRMYALATRILRDGYLAEDALQSAFVTAWRQLPTLRDPDRFEALIGDAKRHGSSFSIASPAQERALGVDLFQQPSADELIDGLAKSFALNVCRQVNSAIIAPRSRGQGLGG